MTSKILRLNLCYLLLAVFLSSCTTLPPRPPASARGMYGVYHRVKKGQTLWRIAQAYQVELEKIAQVNRLSDKTRIYTGQLIFIPDARKVQEELTLPSDFVDQGDDFIWPLKGKVVSLFGMKKHWVKNKGISIRAAPNAFILASRSGKVAFCSESFRGYGRIVILDHLDGYSTVYAHNSKNLVQTNQLVKQGQVIAQAGDSGRAASSELYFEIRKDAQAQNPYFYLPFKVKCSVIL